MGFLLTGNYAGRFGPHQQPYNTINQKKSRLKGRLFFGAMVLLLVQQAYFFFIPTSIA